VLEPSGDLMSVSEGSVVFQREVLGLSYRCGKLVSEMFAGCDGACEIDHVLVEGSEHRMVVIIGEGGSKCLEALGVACNNAHDHACFR
jgi:hypothetical protein